MHDAVERYSISLAASSCEGTNALPSIAQEAWMLKGFWRGDNFDARARKRKLRTVAKISTATASTLRCKGTLLSSIDKATRGVQQPTVPRLARERQSRSTKLSAVKPQWFSCCMPVGQLNGSSTAETLQLRRHFQKQGGPAARELEQWSRLCRNPLIPSGADEVHSLRRS